MVENRLFSEGLHIFGAAPSANQLEQYLEAYFGSDLPPEAVQAVAETPAESLDAVRARLERIYASVRASLFRVVIGFSPCVSPPLFVSRTSVWAYDSFEVKEHVWGCSGARRRA